MIANLKVLKLLFVLLLALGSVPAPVFAEGAEELYQVARKKYYQLINSPQTGEQTDWQIGVEAFRRVVREHPKSGRAPDALFTEGLLFWNMQQRFGKQGDLYSAIEAYEKLIEQYPSDNLADDALYNIAMIHHKDLGDISKATQFLTRLLRAYPKSEMARQAKSTLAALESTSTAEVAPKAPAVAVDKPQPKQAQRLEVSSAPQKKASSDGPVVIENIRYWTNPDYTRVGIYLSGDPKEYNHRLLKKDPKLRTSPRLYVDVSDSSLGSKLERKIQIEDNLLKQVRSGQFKPGTARIVLDLNSIYDYQVSTRNDPHRIVIDVQGAEPQRKATVEATIEKEIASISEPAAKVAPAPQKTKVASIVVEPKQKTGSFDVELKRRQPMTIIIDPGHGGHDPGARGPSGTKEKNVVLAIALKLKEAFAKDPNYRVVLTRDRDVFIPLPKRSKIANQERGHLFVSIHADANHKRSASGISTYIFDDANDEFARQLQERENATIFSSGSSGQPEFLSLMLKSMEQNIFYNKSVDLATTVQETMIGSIKKKYSKVRNLGVKQARFFVLWNVDMPSVLIETSFISNPTEERRLKSEFYQHEIAKAIKMGIVSHLQRNPSVNVAKK